MCLFPTEIVNPKYRNTPADSPFWQTHDPRLRFIKIPCGRCLECRKKRANEWKQRLFEENTSRHEKAYFITLTVSNETALTFGIDYQTTPPPQAEHDMMTSLIASWRKRNHRTSVREKHFFATEKGPTCTERIHAHGIIWTNDDIEILKKNWTAGIFDVGTKGFSEKSISYILKYIMKPDEIHDQFISKIYASKGIGKCFIARNMKSYIEHPKDWYRTPSGFKISLSDYYKKKLYNENARERMRLEKQDQQKAYICGIQYDLTSRVQYKHYIKKLLEEQRRAPKYLRPLQKKQSIFENLNNNLYFCEKISHETKSSIEEYLRRTRKEPTTSLEDHLLSLEN